MLEGFLLLGCLVVGWDWRVEEMDGAEFGQVYWGKGGGVCFRGGALKW